MPYVTNTDLNKKELENKQNKKQVFKQNIGVGKISHNNKISRAINDGSSSQDSIHNALTW
jgi:hypothetical protein